MTLTEAEDSIVLGLNSDAGHILKLGNHGGRYRQSRLDSNVTMAHAALDFSQFSGESYGTVVDQGNAVTYALDFPANVAYQILIEELSHKETQSLHRKKGTLTP